MHTLITSVRSRLSATLEYARISRARVPLALAITAMFALSGYNCNDVLDDPGFDLWCEDRLCAWELESGGIERVQTWHESDYGVEFIGTDVAISQFTDESPRCLRFELIADVEEDAEVVLELDLFGNGVVDYEQRIPTSDWQQLSYRIDMPSFYRGILFRVRKRGGGRVVIAEIAALAETASECADAPGLDTDYGSLCSVGDESCAVGSCASGFLTFDVCSACQSDLDCTDGEVCGMASPDRPYELPYRSCVARESRGLGALCVLDTECASGLCENFVCSTCRDSNDCADGQECLARQDVEGRDWSLAPMQCDPESGAALSGTACLSDSDCASGRCTGTGARNLCLSDSRACIVNADCPGSLFGDTTGDFICANVGLSDGVCE